MQAVLQPHDADGVRSTHWPESAFYASARPQLAPGVVVIASTSVAANLAAIIGGVLVFRDPIGIGVLAIVGRFIAFCLVIASVALMPAPLRTRGPGALAELPARVSGERSRKPAGLRHLVGGSFAGLAGRVAPRS